MISVLIGAERLYVSYQFWVLIYVKLSKKFDEISMRFTCLLKCPNEIFEPKRISIVYFLYAFNLAGPELARICTFD